MVYYSGELNSGDSRSFVLGQFVHDFLTFNTTGDAAATARQQTLWNKVQVSEAYALASQTNPFLVSTAPGQPAFAAEIAIVANVNVRSPARPMAASPMSILAMASTT